jgi:hypothetical protein
MVTVITGNTQRLYRAGETIAVNASGHLVIQTLRGADTVTVAILPGGSWDAVFIGDAPEEAPYPGPPPAAR